MSAALVRKALEVSEESCPGPLLKSLKNSGRRKLKNIEKRKKAQLSPQEVLRRNLKILKALEFSSRAKKYGKISVPKPVARSEVTPNPESTSAPKKLKKKSKKNQKKVPETSNTFTEEDFRQFEAEYFVTD